MSQESSRQSTPSLMPTTPALRKLDPLREELRSKALKWFAAVDYDGYRRDVSRERRLWRRSPTGCYLHAYSLLSEFEVRTVKKKAEVLLEAEELLAESRYLWNQLLDEADLVGHDATLLHSSLDLAAAWIAHLRGNTVAARLLVLARISELRAASKARPAFVPPQFYCSFWYLLKFAAEGKDSDQVQYALELADSHMPGWECDRDFVKHVQSFSRLEFVSAHPCWTDRVHPAVEIHTKPVSRRKVREATTTAEI